MHFNLINDPWVMISKTCQWLLEILIWTEWSTCRLWNPSLFDVRSEVTLDIKVIGNFIGFLKSVETQDFDTVRRNHEVLKLIWFSRYDFEFESIFKFVLAISFHYTIDFQSSLLDAIWMYDVMTTSGPIRPHQKKNLTKYRCRMCRWWQNTLIIVVNSNDVTYAIVVSVPTEKYSYI
jgi:hypothetical protein